MRKPHTRLKDIVVEPRRDNQINSFLDKYRMMTSLKFNSFHLFEFSHFANAFNLRRSIFVYFLHLDSLHDLDAFYFIGEKWKIFFFFFILFSALSAIFVVVVENSLHV